jgi:hypothetical protein
MYYPLNVKRSTHYGNNYWEAFSPKLNRNVRLFSDLEYDHWVLVETNTKIISFCEQPLSIQSIVNNKSVNSIIDMWVLYSNGKESFIEVKYSSELDPSNPKSIRSIRQTTAQRIWCEERNFNYQIITEKDIRSNHNYLDNMRTILPYLRTRTSPIETDKAKIIKKIRDTSITIAEIESSIPEIPSSRLRETLYHLIYEGIIMANVDKIPLSRNTEVWINVEKENC